MKLVSKTLNCRWVSFSKSRNIQNGTAEDAGPILQSLKIMDISVNARKMMSLKFAMLVFLKRKIGQK